MKTRIKSLTLVAVSSLIFLYGCEKNPSEPDEVTDLTEVEQMEIIATEVSQNSGGIMADIEMASSTATNNPGGLAKTVGYDTTFTNSWITFSLNLEFYDNNGNEQDKFYENNTDRIVYKSTVSGEYDPMSGLQDIELDRSTEFDLAGITSGKITFNGVSSNSSSYSFAGVRINLDAAAQSTFTFENLVIDRNVHSYFPLSGSIKALVKGTYNKETLRHNKDVEYKINFTIEFNGGNEVKVNLASGAAFTLNIESGEYSEE